jgi:hypothetical protein
MHPALLEATLLRVRRRIDATDGCPDRVRAGLLLAIANLYQDAGCWARADELYGHVLSITPVPALRVATLRRRAVGQIIGGADHQAMDREFRSIVEYKTNVDLSVSVAICQGWWHLACGQPERCLRELEPFDFDEEAPIPAPTYSPRNVIEFKLTQASALAGLGLSYGSQVRFVRQHQQVQLRPVFTDHIAPFVLASSLAGVIEPMRAGVAPAPSPLAAAAGAILATRGIATATRPIWVD